MTKSDDKRVPALRFKGFTDEWEQRKLGEVAEIIGGGTPSTNISEYWNGNINWYSPTEIGSQTFVNSSKKKITELGLKESSAKLLPGKKTILFTSRAGIGDMAIMNTDGSTNQGFQSWIVKPDITDIYFLYSLGGNLKKQALRKASGSTFLEISNSEVKKLSLYLPDFKEQTIIGKIIRLIDKLVTLQQRKVNDYFQYKTQLINTIFANKNWQIIKLRDVLSVPKEELANVTTKSQIMTVKLNLGGIINGANRDTLNLSATKYYIRHAGQFIFGKQNFFNGSMAIIPKAMDGKVTSQDVPALNINNEKINSKFLLYYLSRRNFYKHTERFATGTGSKRLHVDTLLNFKIRIPDISYQNQIVSTLTLLDKKLQLETTKLNKLKQLKQFLLQNMFI